MTDVSDDLLAEIETGTELAPNQGQSSTGILPSQTLESLVKARAIASRDVIDPDQIQPASIDLRLGASAYRVQASFLPGREFSVAEKIEQLILHEFSIADGAVLEKGCVYIVPLMESLNLSSKYSGIANPKSSTGRLDIFTRLITNHSTTFDQVDAGYRGPLYAEISPRTFSVLVRQGSRLNQLRIRRGNPLLTQKAMQELQENQQLVDTSFEKSDAIRGIPITVDLSGEGNNGIVAYRAKKHSSIIDVDMSNHYDPTDYWDPIYSGKNKNLILNPDDFYILASKQPVKVPDQFAAEMVAYDTLVGEFRVHYAGFFDPGFGYSEHGDADSKAVLEVRSHEVPFMVEDGQLVGRLKYERLAVPAKKVYGQEIESNYQRQGLQLSKHFTPWPAR